MGIVNYENLSPPGTSSGGTGLTVEQVRDAVATFIQSGTGISVAHDDTANTLTIASTVINTDTQLTTEQVQDIVAAFIAAGTNVTVTYDDAANSLTIASTGGGSGGLSQAEVDARVTAGVEDWAEDGNAILIPDLKIPANIARDTEITSGISTHAGVDDAHHTPTPDNRKIPSGGTTGQVLKKDTATDYDTSWQDDQAGSGGGLTESQVDTRVNTLVPENRRVPSGGSTGQVLKKDTGTNYDVSWQDDEQGTGGGSGSDPTGDAKGDLIATSGTLPTANQARHNDDNIPITWAIESGISDVVATSGNDVLDFTGDRPEGVNGILIESSTGRSVFVPWGGAGAWASASNFASYGVQGLALSDSERIFVKSGLTIVRDTSAAGYGHFWRLSLSGGGTTIPADTVISVYFAVVRGAQGEPGTGGGGIDQAAVDTSIATHTSDDDAHHALVPDNRKVPAGGITGQVLKKDTATDYDVSWQDDEAGSGGGGLTESQVDTRVTTLVEDWAEAANTSTEVPDGKIPSTIARDTEIEGWARTANPSTDVPESKIPSAIARTSAIPADNRLVPSGGATGQVLKKDTATNYDVSWQDDSEGSGSGSTTGEVKGDLIASTGTLPTSTQTAGQAAINVLWAAESGTGVTVTTNGDTIILPRERPAEVVGVLVEAEITESGATTVGGGVVVPWGWRRSVL